MFPSFGSGWGVQYIKFLMTQQNIDLFIQETFQSMIISKMNWCTPSENFLQIFTFYYIFFTSFYTKLGA